MTLISIPTTIFCLDHLPDPREEPHNAIIALDPHNNNWIMLVKRTTVHPRRLGDVSFPIKGPDSVVQTIVGWADAKEQGWI